MTRADAKAAAKRLQKETGMTYGHCLDAIAKLWGFKDWNTLSAYLKYSEAS